MPQIGYACSINKRVVLPKFVTLPNKLQRNITPTISKNHPRPTLGYCTVMVICLDMTAG